MLWLICIFACSGGSGTEVSEAATLAYWTVESAGGFSEGEALFNLGDLDGDGADELGVVTSNADGSPGSVLYALRSGDSLDAPFATLALPHNDWVVSVGSCDDPMVPARNPIMALGDLNGDGLGEVAIADADAGRGGVWVIDGAAWRSPATAYEQSLLIDGQPDVWMFGSDLSAGDLDGDGLLDLVVGAPLTGQPARAGQVWVFSGTVLADRVGSVQADALGNGFKANRRDTLMGERVQVSPDIDGDGLPDVLALSPACGDEGASGGIASIANPLRAVGSEAQTNPTNAMTTGGAVSTGLVPLGDSDGDGAIEVALAGWRLDEDEPYEVGVFNLNQDSWREPSTRLQTGENSRAQVHSWMVNGRVALLAVDARYVIQVTEPRAASGWQKLDSVLLPCESELRGDQHRVAPGDYNGDGVQELAVGVPECKDQASEGRAYVFEWPALTEEP